MSNYNSVVAVAGTTTKVKKIVVGTPVRRVTAGAFSIGSLGGVDTTGAINGSVLLYNESSGKFEAEQELENTNFNGGQY
jgi:hypothetical protein